MAENGAGASPLVRLNEATFVDWAERRVPLTLVLARSAACRQSIELEPMLEQVGSELAGRVRLATLDVEESPQLAARHSISGVPTILMLRNGVRVGAMASCSVSAERLLEFVVEHEGSDPGPTS